MIISYSTKYRSKVIDAFGLEEKDGLLFDKKTGNVVKDNLNGDLTVKRFGGVRKGSIEYINKDVASILKLRTKLKEK